jgi:predicted Zn-dependent protease
MSRLRLARIQCGVAFAAILAVAGCAAVSQFNIVSEPQELEMGAQFAAQLEDELEFVNDAEVVGYVDRLGQSLARASKRSNIPYKFHVVKDDDVNAFAVPGGYLYVNRGLIEAADNESELAGVIGHEIGHVVGRHSARQMSQQYGLQMIAGVALGQNPGMLAQMTAGLLANGAMMRYSRDMESEADALGVDELYAAGYDPNGIATFFDKLEAMHGGSGGGAVAKYFSSHPDPGARAAATRARIAQLPPKSGLKKDSPEFQRIKQRV